METNYGVGVSNRYNLFLDEDADPLEILKIQEEEKAKAAKKEKIAVKDTKGKPGSKAGPKKEEASKKVVRPVAALSESNRGDLGKPRSDIVKRDENRNEGAPRYDNRGGDEGGRGGRGGFRGRGGGFGGGRGGGRGRGGGTYEARGKREYERHSGTDKTGIKAVEKREGGGAHNWGRATDNYENAGWTPSEETVNGTAEVPEASKEGVEDKKEPLAEGEEGKEETTAVDENEAEKAEPEETLLTLEEWKALQEEKRNKPTFNIRRAGEGEDPKQWKNTFVLKKKEPLSDEESEEEEEEEEEEEVGRQQSMAEQIQFVFFSGPARRGGRGRGRGGRGGGPPTERGERGERGGGRGGFERRGGGERGGRGGGRFGDRPGPGRERVQHAPRVDDENDFPAL